MTPKSQERLKKLRALTEKQRFALRMVDKGWVEIKLVPVAWRKFPPVLRMYWALDTDISLQIKSLRKRGLVKWRDRGAHLYVTAEGEIELAKEREQCLSGSAQETPSPTK